jgi:hypothetical protein
MNRILMNVIDVINNSDGSKDKIFMYQDQELRITTKGFKSLVNTEITYFNLKAERVSPFLQGFRKLAIGNTTHYSTKMFH